MDKPITNWGARCDLEIKRGADYFMPIQLLTDPGGLPIATSTATIQAAIKLTRTSSAVLAAFEVTSVDPTVGTFLLKLPAAQAELLPESDCPTQCVWDAKFTDTDGTLVPLLYGDVTVLTEVA